MTAKQGACRFAATLLHGADAAATAEAAEDTAFEEGGYRPKTCRAWVARGGSGPPVSACWRTCGRGGLVASKGEARRQTQGGGLRVNDMVVSDEKMVLTPRDLTGPGGRD